MVTQSDIEKLKTLAKEKFEGHFDKAGKPYFEHMEFVSKKAMTLATIGDMSDYEISVIGLIGYCHDLVEDTDVSFEDLKFIKDSDYEVYDAIVLMTRVKGVDYSTYLSKIAKDKYARIVKMADLIHNSQIKRYSKSTRDEHKDCCLLYAERLSKLLSMIDD